MPPKHWGWMGNWVATAGILADLVVLNMHGLHAVPNYSLIDNIIYTCTGRDVELVLVNGQIVVEGGNSRNVDEEN